MKKENHTLKSPKKKDHKKITYMVISVFFLALLMYRFVVQRNYITFKDMFYMY